MGPGVETYGIVLLKRAQKDIAKIKKSGTNADRKNVERILDELRAHPRAGIGRPKQLRHRQGEVWARKVNEKDRFVYEIHEDGLLVEVEQVLGHYDDR